MLEHRLTYNKIELLAKKSGRYHTGRSWRGKQFCNDVGHQRGGQGRRDQTRVAIFSNKKIRCRRVLSGVNVACQKVKG